MGNLPQQSLQPIVVRKQTYLKGSLLKKFNAVQEELELSETETIREMIRFFWDKKPLSCKSGN